MFLYKMLAIYESLYSDGPPCIAPCFINYTGLEIELTRSEVAEI